LLRLQSLGDRKTNNDYTVSDSDSDLPIEPKGSISLLERLADGEPLSLTKRQLFGPVGSVPLSSKAVLGPLEATLVSGATNEAPLNFLPASTPSWHH
jgi:hypothetical protein